MSRFLLRQVSMMTHDSSIARMVPTQDGSVRVVTRTEIDLGLTLGPSPMP